MQKLGSGKATVKERRKPMFSRPIFKREKRQRKNNIAVFFAAAAAITAMFGGFVAGHGIMLTFAGTLLAIAMVILTCAFLVMHLSVANTETTDENVTQRPPRLLRTKTSAPHYRYHTYGRCTVSDKNLETISALLAEATYVTTMQSPINHNKTIVDVFFTVSPDNPLLKELPDSSLFRWGEKGRAYISFSERMKLEELFNGYLAKGYTPLDAAYRSFTPVIRSVYGQPQEAWRIAYEDLESA